MIADEHEEEIKRLEMQSYRWRRILMFLPGILFFATMAWLFLRPGCGLLRPESECQTYDLLASIRKRRNQIPSPVGSVLIYERYNVCWQWQEAGVLAIYATGETWEEVESYYRYEQNSPVWTECRSSNNQVYCFSRSPQDTLQLTLHVEQTDGEGLDLPPGVMERAHQIGTTVYKRGIRLWDSEASRCPGWGWDICTCPWSYWERSWAGWRPVTPLPVPTSASIPYPEPLPPPQSDPYSIPFYP